MNLVEKFLDANNRFWAMRELTRYSEVIERLLHRLRDEMTGEDATLLLGLVVRVQEARSASGRLTVEEYDRALHTVCQEAHAIVGDFWQRLSVARRQPGGDLR